MSRFNQKHYQRRLAVAMFIYVAAMLLVWPMAQQTTQILLKTTLACLPVLPMLYVIGLMAQRVRYSDELEQRTHLVALGAATALVATLSLIGGFLAAAGVVTLNGSILIWVFPLTIASYGVANWWVITRRYGGDMACDEGGWTMPYRLLLVGVLMGMVALAAWWRGRLDATSLGMLTGMALVLVIAGAVRMFRFWRRSTAGRR